MIFGIPKLISFLGVKTVFLVYRNYSHFLPKKSDVSPHRIFLFCHYHIFKNSFYQTFQSVILNLPNYPSGSPVFMSYFSLNTSDVKFIVLKCKTALKTILRPFSAVLNFLILIFCHSISSSIRFALSRPLSVVAA